jgi:precorrin-2 dehydrogenase / sirohydrochlorin ferrochelatase
MSLPQVAIDFPIAIRLQERWVLVVGGGEVAERRTRALMAAGARLRVVARDSGPGLRAMAARFEYRQRDFLEGDLEGMSLAFAATDDRSTNRQVAELARRHGVLVNVSDDPEACDFTMPAVVRAGPVCVAVTSSGLSPALAARIRTQIGRGLLRPAHGTAARLLGEIRSQLPRSAGLSSEHADAMRRTLDAGLVEAVESHSAAAIDRALAQGFGGRFSVASLGFDLGGEDAAIVEGA